MAAVIRRPKNTGLETGEGTHNRQHHILECPMLGFKKSMEQLLEARPSGRVELLINSHPMMAFSGIGNASMPV